jgi:deoxyribonuclease V
MKRLHEWDISYAEAIKLQKLLAGHVRRVKIRKKPQLLAGIDCALTADKKKIIGCVVVLTRPHLDAVEIRHAVKKLTFPYIPGLLSFREAPVCIEAAEKLKHKPDLFMIDGQGVAHPRRLGLAAHLGLFFDKPTIGCAKSRLVGEYKQPKVQRGSFSLLEDNDETIGAVVRTRTGVKPLFISVGHKCTLDDAIKWTLDCATKYRLPEPTRLAHIEVGKIKASS